jgi:hypothetical protein
VVERHTSNPCSSVELSVQVTLIAVLDCGAAARLDGAVGAAGAVAHALLENPLGGADPLPSARTS